MLDAVQCMRTKSILYHQFSPETVRYFSTELEQYTARLSELVLMPARDLDNLSSYLTTSFSTVTQHLLPQTPPSPPAFDHVDNEPVTSPIATIDSDKNTVDDNSLAVGGEDIKDLNHFKFGPSIVLAFPCDMIASNGRTILCYVIEKNFLNYSTITGRNLSSIKVYRLLAPINANNARLWDMVWCPWSKFYLM